MPSAVHGIARTGPAVFNRIKVFSATMARNREVLGELVTDWLASDRSRRVVDVVVAQSSDAAFHCVSIIVFAWEDPAS